MTIREAVIEELRGLAPEEQQKVLAFVRSLQPPGERRNPRGMFIHRGIHIAAEDIDEARREAWANFPRNLPQGQAP